MTTANWQRASLLLCSYGFFKAFRPGEPFLTDFLGPSSAGNDSLTTKNFSLVVIYGDIYPWWTYSYLCCLVPVFLLTDLLRYKPVLVLETLALASTWAALIWGSSVRSQQVMQALYGLCSATEVAYYAYIYNVVQPAHYATVTSWVRAALLTGKVSSYGLAQLLISEHWADYLALNYISLGFICVTLPLALALPRVTTPSSAATEKQNRTTKERIKLAAKAAADEIDVYFRSLWKNIVESYVTKTSVLKWSVWWALATCGYLQVGNYIQALLVALVQLLHVDWLRWGELTLTTATALQTVLLFVANCNQIWLCYAAYVLYACLYQVLITVATLNVARKIEHYALVFGINWFIALVLQSILTLTVADAHGLSLGIRAQFYVYAVYHGAICLLFAPMAVYTLVTYSRQQRTTQPAVTDHS